MRKELLLSLIAAGAVPVSALADIDVTSTSGIKDAGKWENNGLGSVEFNPTNDVFINVNGSSAVLTCMIGGTTLPQGDYKITAVGSNLKLTIDGEEASTFVHDGQGLHTVMIEGKENSSYSLNSIKLEVVVDFAAIKNDLLALTAEDSTTTIETAPVEITATGSYANGLEGIKTNVEKAIAGINVKLALLDGEETLEIYKREDLELWADDSQLKKDVKKVVDQLAEYNKKATEQNTLSANYNNNQATKEKWKTYAESLNAAVEGYNEGEIDEWVKEQMAGANSDFETAYTQFIEGLVIFDTDVVLEGSSEVDEDGNIIPNDYDNIVAAHDKLQDLADAVNNEKTTAEADLVAYNNIEGYIEAIKKTYTSNYNQFMGLTGKQGSDWAAELTKIKDDALAKIGENVKKGASAKVAAAEATKNEAVDELNNKKDKVVGLVAASEDAYSTDTAALAKSVANFEALKAELEKVPSKDLYPDKEKLDSIYADIEDSIKVATSKAKEQKIEYACATVGITSNITNIDAAIAELTIKITDAQALAGGWGDNNSALDALQARLDAANKKLGEIDEKTGYNIKGKFTGAYNAVKGSIKTAKDNNDENLRNTNTAGYINKPVDTLYVEKGVKEFEDKAIPTAEAFDVKLAAHQELTDSLESLRTQIDAAVILEEDNAKSQRTSYKKKCDTYEGYIETIKTDMEEASKREADALYQAVDAVNENPSLVKDKIAADKKNFAKAVTNGNLTKLNGKATAYNNELTATDAADVFGPGLDATKVLMDEYQTLVTELAQKVYDAADATDPTSEYKALNPDIVALYAEIENVAAAMEVCKNNVAAKAAYDTSNLVTEVDGLEQWVKDNTSVPATTPWLEHKDYKEICDNKDSLDAAIVRLYGKNELTKESKDGDKSALQTKVDEFKKAVKDNETAHDKQVEYSEAAIAEVLKAIDDVKNSGYSDKVTFNLTISNEEKNMTLAEIKVALAELQKGLQPLNKQVYDDYAALGSKENNPYEELLGEVREYIDGIASDYYRAVKAANKATAEAAMQGLHGTLAEEYQNAVLLYNKVSAKKQGDEYNAYVGILLGNGGNIDAVYGHAVLQQHYVVLTEIESKKKEILDAELPELSATGEVAEGTEATDYHVLESKAFDGIKNEVANASTAMNNYIDGLTTDVDGYAATYLTGKFSDALSTITTAESNMQTAGLSEEQILAAILNANQHYISAQAYIYTSDSDIKVDDADGTTGAVVGDIIPSDSVKSGNIDTYIRKMNAALTELGQVKVETKVAISSYWVNLVEEADALVAELQTALDEDKENSQPADFATAQAKWDDAVDDINNVKNSASTLLAATNNDGYLAAGIGSYTTQLQTALANAQDAIILAGQAASKNAANMTRIEVYKKTLEEVKANLATLHEKVGNLGLTFDEFQAINVMLADDAVNDFAGALVVVDGEGNVSDIKNAFDNRAAINALIDAANQAIADAYNRAYNAELGYLGKIHTQVLSDFNNKYAEVGHETEQLTKWDTAIKAQKALIDAAPNHGVELETDENGNPIAITPVQQLEALTGIEEALLAIQSEMGVSDSSNDQATGVAVDKLNEIKANVQGYVDVLNNAINTLEETLNKSVLEGWSHNEIPAAAYNVQDVLNSIEEAYKGDNSVETSYSYYKNQLNNLKNEIGTTRWYGYQNDVRLIQKAADEEVSKRETSNTLADALNAELTAATEYYNNVLTDISNYEKLTNDYQEQMDIINADIVYDEYDNVIGGGLLTIAKLNVENARNGFELNAGNTYIGYHEDEELQEYVLDDHYTTNCYNLVGIYESIEALELAAAQEETAGWRNDARIELNIANSAISAGKHVNQQELEVEVSECWNIFWENWYTSNEITECSRQKMTFKTLIANAQALVTSAEENYYKPGDLNEDGSVTTSDFIQLIDIILKKEEAPVKGSVLFAAADLNDDGEIGVGDAVKEMRIINRLDGSNSAALIQKVRTAAECSATLAAGMLNIDNNIEIASVMIDLKGVTADQLVLASRAAGMQMMTNTLADGTLRVVIIANNGTTLAGNQGAVLEVAGNAGLAKVVVSDTLGNEYTIADNGGATAIDQITNAIKNAGQKIYDMSGKLMNGLKKGVNIIRNADGSSNKVLK